MQPAASTLGKAVSSSSFPSLRHKQVEHQRQLDALRSQTLDLLVVGGGIVGSGVARDAAMRGLKVGLVEQHDFASGTSSRSSRLLHGGLRYLAKGHLGLVREASLEKRILAKIAPHLAQPLGFLFPAYQGEGPPWWQLRIGVKIYDLLCSGRNFRPSTSFNRVEARRLLPQLKSENLVGLVRYFDALTSDARLVIDTLSSATRYGANISNQTKLVSSRRLGESWQSELVDKLSGQTLTVHARTIINATGPWADLIPAANVRLRLTKGIHVVIDHSRLPVPSAVVITADSRIIFVLPWGGRVILGTTDTDYHGAPEDVSVDEADVTYILEAVNDFFPTARIDKSDIVSAWAGLRPLVANADGSPSDISRAHEIKRNEPGWWDITGGKLTTYRLMAEQAVDKIVAELNLAAGRCQTAEEPLLGMGVKPRFSGILPPPCTEAAVRHYMEEEWAHHLADVMIRRSGWHYYDRSTDQIIGQVADWMAAIGGWDATRRDQEISLYLQEVIAIM